MIERIKASMAVPLRGRDDDLGVLYVDNRSVPDRFRQEDLDFLAAFANHAAAAIENARLLARLEREAELRNSLLRFFPPATAGELLAGGLPTVETEVTALFCDISGYTPLAASLRPFEVIGLLNSYFPIVAEIVFRHGGMLEKYIGDAILAVWGVPRRGPEDADRALAAAIDMQRALAERNAHLPEGQPPLHVHIGLNSGPVAAGNIGSDAYVQYATIGDATNTAARVCGAAAADEILLSESTWLRLSHRPRAQVRDGVPLKGKGGTARLFLVGW
jgi:adenylate cyclase